MSFPSYRIEMIASVPPAESFKEDIMEYWHDASDLVSSQTGVFCIYRALKFHLVYEAMYSVIVRRAQSDNSV